MDEPLDFLLDDDTDGASPVGDERWRVLIVDDDADIHTVSSLVLNSFEFLGRSLELLHAHSAREAFTVLEAEREIAVILLDVVMESNDAGLKLVERIRGELGNTRVRIILRTGQPGAAPELEVVRDYDINDYKTKSELTRSQLCTALTAALRAYLQLEQMERDNAQLREQVDVNRNKSREAAGAAQRLVQAEAELRATCGQLADASARTAIAAPLEALERELGATVAACRALDADACS